MPIKIKALIAASLFILASAVYAYLTPQAQTTPQNLSIKHSTFDGYPALFNVTYCTMGGERLLMDIVLPGKPGPSPRPFVLYVHGGGWTMGGRSDLGYFNLKLLSEGYAVGTLDYRLAPQYKFPAQIEDVKCAIRFVRKNAALIGVDPNKIAADGSSAGGNLVSLLGLTNSSMWDVGPYANVSDNVSAVVDEFGPSNITSFLYYNASPGMRAYYDGIFSEVFASSPELLSQASPVNHVTGNAPPFLIIQGLQDSTVPYNQSVQLYNLLVSAGDTANIILVENAGHMLVQVGPNPISPSMDSLNATVANFLNEHLGWNATLQKFTGG